MKGARRSFILIGLALAVAMTVLRLADPWPVQSLRLFYFDALQRLNPREPADLPVRVVVIDEDSLSAIGQWPWPRTILGELARRLGEQGAAVVVFDVLFAEPDRYSPARLLDRPELGRLMREDLNQSELSRLDGDAIFAKRLAELRCVVGVAATTTQGPAITYDKGGFVEIGQRPAAGLISLRSTTPLVPAIRSAAAGIGVINVDPTGEGGVVRRVPLLWQTPAGTVPSLSVESLRVALGQSTVLIHGSPDLEAVTESIQIGDYRIPTTDDGQLWLRFRRDDPSRYISAKDVLENSAQLRQLIEGSIVFVGTSAAGLLDIRTTALGENVPGVSIHAQMLEQILAGDYLYRSDLISGVEVLVFVGLSLIVIVLLSRFGPIASMGVGGASAVLVLAASYILQDGAGILFDATFPLLGGAANYGVLTSYRFFVADREKRMIRRSFSRYVSPDVLHQIETSGYKLELGGEIRDLTIMFCDIRQFTGFSEKLSPAEIVTVLNELFTQLSGSILDQKGTIDKFIGDSIMAFWNAPLTIEDHGRSACLAALGMRDRLERFNRSELMADKPKIGLAIGCASGPACVGNVGSAWRFNYSVIGDTVNVASRIESSCRAIQYPIVVSRSTSESARDLAILPAGRIGIRGRSERMDVDIVVGDAEVAGSPLFETLAQRHSELLSMIETGSGHLASDDPIRKALAECAQIAAQIDPDLAGFYEAIPTRIDDFSRSRSGVETDIEV